MQGTSNDLEDQHDVDERVDVTELIARIAAERGVPVDDTGRHRLQVDPALRRTRRRRLAPAIAGVATVLVAAGIALTVRPGDRAPDGPELDAALVASSPSSAPATPTRAVVPAPQAVTPEKTAPTAAPATGSTPGRTTGAPTPAAAATAKPATVAPAVDGVQAATANRWKLVDRDEFTGPLSAKWVRYDGEGNSGKGRRTPDAVTVSGGTAVIRGDQKGSTGGMSWRDDRRTGRWEMRAKFPKGDAQYHPVLLLWPENGGSDDGEVDFAETTSAADSVSFFLHHGSGDQATAKKQVDITQWHNYAVEVTADRVTGYVDGQKWFESTDRDTLPRAPVHPVIQLDWFPKGNSPEPSEMLVGWMRIYE
jgi:Glycosyl hydrolases family 16